jgi:hypothetical protein
MFTLHPGFARVRYPLLNGGARGLLFYPLRDVSQRLFIVLQHPKINPSLAEGWRALAKPGCQLFFSLEIHHATRVSNRGGGRGFHAHGRHSF